jgi:hypothetical protein
VESLTESLRSLIKNWVFGVVTNIVLEPDIYREGDKYAYVKALYDDVKTIQEDQSAKGKMSRELQKELRGLQEELRGLQEALVMKEE